MALALDHNLKLRLVSTAILAPIVLFCLIQGGAWFAALLVIATLCMLLEWHQLTERQAYPQDLWLLLAPSFFAALLAFLGYYKLALMMLAAAFFVRLLGLLRPPRASVWPLVGLGYIMVPVIGLLSMMHQPHGYLTVLWLFLVVWASDIGGYFFGKGIGGPKIAPSISPKKTWSGLLGGMACSGLTGAAVAWHIHSPMGLVVGLSVALAVIAQVGDFFESKVKRLFDKKDSGQLIPGHGGILDRVDGLLAAAMVLWGAIVFDAYLTRPM